MSNEVNEIRINIPEGMEIDKENSTFECIKFKPIEKELPKTWEEFCINTLVKEGECYIDTFSIILPRNSDCEREFDTDKNTLPNKKTAEAMLALCQLIQLRDYYNDGWEPNWTTDSKKYSIYMYCGQIFTIEISASNRILVFKTAELRDQFLENFRDLIEIAKPLL